MATAEQRAREEIDRLLTAAGWSVQDFKAADIHAARGVALREFQLNPGFGFADYLLYVDGNFDTYLIGLTATPYKQSFDYFNKNLMMEYACPQSESRAEMAAPNYLDVQSKAA